MNTYEAIKADQAKLTAKLQEEITATKNERDEYYAAWQEASKEIDRLHFRNALLEEQTKKAIRLSKMENGAELAKSYLADWDALHQTMDEDYAEISQLRDEVARLEDEPVDMTGEMI